MDSDEQAIRSLIATWMEASTRGDLGRVLELRLEGPSLSVLRRTGAGRWVIFRDANMITPAGDPPGVAP